MGKYNTALYNNHTASGQSYTGQTTRAMYDSAGNNAGRFASHEAAGRTSCTPYATYTSDTPGSVETWADRNEAYGIGYNNHFHAGANYTRGNGGPSHPDYYQGKADREHGGSYNNATHQTKNNR